MNDRLDEWREYFAKCDANDDGRIQFDEFTELLKNIGAEASADEARIGFEAVDTDNDGVISFDEFVNWWTDQ